MTSKDFSVAWALTATFSTCVLSEATLEGTVDQSLQDNVEIPYNWIEYIYHVDSSLDLHSIIQSGLIAGGEKIREKED